MLAAQAQQPERPAAAAAAEPAAELEAAGTLAEQIGSLRAQLRAVERAEQLEAVKARRWQAEQWRKEREAAETGRRAAAAVCLAALEEEEAAFAAREVDRRREVMSPQRTTMRAPNAPSRASEFLPPPHVPRPLAAPCFVHRGYLPWHLP